MVKAVRMSVTALVAAWPLATQAAEFDRVIVFGDSLSDVGNLYTATAGRQPLSPPYADGRFSNGPVWAEYFSPGIRGSTAGITAAGSLDYAFGGATTGSGQAIPGLLDQVGLFQADKAAGRIALGDRDVVVVWAGANDYFTVLPTLPSTDPTAAATALARTADTAVGNAGTAITRLIAAGARTIIVPTLPDLGGAPGYSQDSAAKLAAGTATIYHNQRLGNELAAIKASNPAINIVTVPVVTLEAAIMANPGAFGIANTSAACLNKTTGTVCASTQAGQNSYFFWDDVHPTTGTHALIAQAARIMTAGAEAATRSADSQGDAGMLLSRAMDRDVGDRLRRLHDGAVGSRISMAALTLGGIGPQLAAAEGYPGTTLAEAPADIERPFAMFASGGWQTARLDAASDRTGFSQDGATIAIGGDWRPLPDLALGLAAGYGSGDVSLKGNGGSFDLAAWRLTAYAAYTRPNWYVDGTLGHAWLGFDDIRRNTGFGGVATSGETDGRAVTASLGSGYRLSRGNATFGPVAGLRWTRLSVGAYSETGGFGLGQRWDRQTADALSGELGVEAILHHRFRGTVVEPRLRLAWEPMIEDGRRNVRARLLDNTADAVSAGARGLGDAVSVEAGLDARLAGGAALGIAYQGSWELQAGGASHRVAAHLAVKF